MSDSGVEVTRFTQPTRSAASGSITATDWHIPARLQVWLPQSKIDGEVVAVDLVDVRMFLRDLDFETEALPIDFGVMRSYVPGARHVKAHLMNDPGWRWVYKNIGGRRVAVAKEVQHGD